MSVFKHEYGDVRLWVGLTLIFSTLALAVWGLIAFLIHFSDVGCARVCEANGDENAYHWTTDCYCRDAEGLYNPKDSRNDQ